MTLQHLPADDRAVHTAVAVHADTLGAGVLRARGLHVLDEGGDFARCGAADPNPLPDARQLVRTGVGTGLGIGDVDGVVSGDGDPARPAELPPFGEVPAFLIEDLDAIVLAIADEQPPLRI